MKRFKLFAAIAMGVMLSSSFLAFQTMKPSPETELQQKNDEFRVIPIEDYEGSFEDLPEGTQKFTKVKLSAKTRVSTERTFLRIPN